MITMYVNIISCHIKTPTGRRRLRFIERTLYNGRKVDRRHKEENDMERNVEMEFPTSKHDLLKRIFLEGFENRCLSLFMLLLTIVCLYIQKVLSQSKHFQGILLLLHNECAWFWEQNYMEPQERYKSIVLPIGSNTTILQNLYDDVIQ